jgi:hypothetical protein
MPIRVVRFQSRNPLVAALVIALVLAVLLALLTVGLAVGGVLAAVGGAALLVRRASRGRHLPPAEPHRLDRSREVFPPSPEERQTRRLPPGAD